ncbi:MAG: hypothetical protein HONBIEJF_01588 [Fimbriimonadaceae bacterium]|nr:hypothetical protein [Fimbriimonadaceae bacterium]
MRKQADIENVIRITLTAGMGFIAGLLLGKNRLPSPLRKTNVGTDPIMLNMIKDEVRAADATNGGAFAVYFSQPTTVLRAVEVSIDGTSNANNPASKFEATVVVAANPVNNPLRLCRHVVVKLRAGETVTADTTVHGTITVKEGARSLRTEAIEVTFRA